MVKVGSVFCSSVEISSSPTWKEELGSGQYLAHFICRGEGLWHTLLDCYRVATHPAKFIEVGYHDDDVGVFFPYHPPEVWYGHVQWPLGSNVLLKVGVALGVGWGGSSGGPSGLQFVPGLSPSLTSM